MTRSRLKNLEQTLEFQAGEEDGLEYLREAHLKHLPPVYQEEND